MQIITIGPATSARLVPVEWDATAGAYRLLTTMYMAGGHYADIGDSRMTDLLSTELGYRFYGALAIHDRRE